MFRKKKVEDKESSTSKLLFKILLVIVTGVFIYIFLSQPSGSYSFTENKLRSSKPAEKEFKSSDSRPAKSVPSELKWHDVFKGVGNE